MRGGQSQYAARNPLDRARLAQRIENRVLRVIVTVAWDDLTTNSGGGLVTTPDGSFRVPLTRSGGCAVMPASTASCGRPTAAPSRFACGRAAIDNPRRGSTCGRS